MGALARAAAIGVGIATAGWVLATAYFMRKVAQSGGFKR